jgi:acetylornithine deacetylase/succinyl-diaminopimelate desuccinylase-like protein
VNSDIVNRVVELAVEIQQIPGPTFHEEKRAEFVRQRFIEEGLHEIATDEAGNVLGCFPGMGEAKPLIVSAHMDTVFPMETDLRIKRGVDSIHGAGLGDNSLGVASLFGLIWSLRERAVPLPGDVWLVANVCEEGLGDLRGMKSVVKRFESDVHAYLVLEGLALGHVYHRAVGVRRYRVTARTGGGHSWSDYGQPSAVHELAKLVVALTSLVLPSHPRTTMNIGKISGGTSVNVIASQATLDLDLRSERPEPLSELVSAVERLIQHANRPGVTVEAEVIGQRPAGEIPASHPLVVLAKDCLREQGLEAGLIAGSTDANVPLSKGYPATVLGVTTGGSAHTIHEFIHTAPVAKGMEQLVRFVSRVWGW